VLTIFVEFRSGSHGERVRWSNGTVIFPQKGGQG
jgi:hypothetical protein